MLLGSLADESVAHDNSLLSNITLQFPTSNDSLLKIDGFTNNTFSLNASTIVHDNQSSSRFSPNTQFHFGMPKMDNVVDIFTILCSLAVIFGGLVPYIPQYLKIKRSMNNDGFSTYVCLTLLIANILRISFWFGHHFEQPLLIQSFVMIAVMLAMMEICIRVRERKGPQSMISTIGSGTNYHGRVMGKLDDTVVQSHSVNNEVQEDDDEGISESTPIYSVIIHPPPLLPTQYSVNSDTPAQQQQQRHEAQSSVHNQSAYQVASYQDSQPEDTSISLDKDSFTSATSQIDDSLDSTTPRPIASLHSNHSSVVLHGTGWTQVGNKCFNRRNFWDWDDYFSYVKFLLLFTFIVGLLTYLLLDNYLYVETLGFVAVLTESMLGVPQLLRNYNKKSTRGMSVEMIIMWLTGDLFKTLYFIFRHAPVQFYVCGSVQVLVDLLILGQVMLYRRPNVTYRRLPKST